MKKSRGSLITFYTMGVAVFFLAGFFLLVVFGAQTYREVAQGQERNNQTRVLLSYLSTCVRTGDRADAVQVVPGAGGGADVAGTEPGAGGGADAAGTEPGAGDGADAVEAVPGSGNMASPMLVVADGDSGYAIRIYMEDGRLLEEYGSLEAAPNSSAAQEIGRTEVFQVEELTKGTFAVTTDAGRTLFSVRSKGGMLYSAR